MKIKDLKSVCNEWVVIYLVGGEYVTECMLADLNGYDDEVIDSMYFETYNGLEIFLEKNMIKEWLNE